MPLRITLLAAICSLLLISQAGAQIVSSDPLFTPTAYLSINGGAAQSLVLVATTTAGVWDIAPSQAIKDAPVGTPIEGAAPAPNDPYLSYGFTETNSQSTMQSYVLTFVLAAPIPPGPTIVNSSFAVSITNGSPTGTYSISPLPGNTSLQYSYLGTSGNPTQTDAGVDLGQGFSFTTPPDPNSGANSYASAVIPGPNGPYSQLTIVTSFQLSPGTIASGDGSFNVTTIPEPSSWSMMLGGLGLLLLGLRRAATQRAV